MPESLKLFAKHVFDRGASRIDHATDVRHRCGFATGHHIVFIDAFHAETSGGLASRQNFDMPKGKHGVRTLIWKQPQRDFTRFVAVTSAQRRGPATGLALFQRLGDFPTQATGQPPDGEDCRGQSG